VKAADFMRKANSSLRAARLLLDNGFPDEASSRAYYAMFDAARAALLVVNAPIEAEIARTHRGLIAAFGLHVVKAGLVAADFGRSFAQAQQVRLIADYKGDPINLADAARMVEWAAAFVQNVAQVFGLTDTPKA
jgi:uncharacterized protein (UPF0332 family)